MSIDFVRNKAEGQDQLLDADTSITKTLATYLARCLEINRFLGAPVGAAYLLYAAPAAFTTDEMTVDVQVSTVIGNGAGLLSGFILDWLLQKHYRTGSHEVRWVAEEPSEDNYKRLGIQMDAAYLRYKNNLYYVNNIMGTVEPLIDADPEEVKTFFETELKMIKPEGDVYGLNAQMRDRFAQLGRHKPYTGSTSTNPFYRTFKTLANVGWQFGATITNFLGFQDPLHRKLWSCILSDLFCLVFGLSGAFLYWYFREKWYQIPPNSPHQDDKTGGEGFTKYSRTIMNFGIFLGNTLGSCIAYLEGAFDDLNEAGSSTAAAVSSYLISFWGGVMGLAAFVLGLVMVPLVNWYSRRNYRVIVLAEDVKAVPEAGRHEKNIYLKHYTDNKGKNYYKAFVWRQGKECSTDISFPGKLKDLYALNDLNIEQALEQPEGGERLITNANLTDAIASQCTLGVLTSDDRNYYKNNYTRTGMVLVSGLFAAIGLGIGAPFGLALMGATIASAAGGVVGGVVFTFYGRHFHRFFHPIPQGPWAENKRAAALVKEGSRERSYQLYLMKNEDLKVENFEATFQKLPNGLRTIVLVKDANRIRAYWIGKISGFLPRTQGGLRLSIDDFEYLSHRFDDVNRPGGSNQTITENTLYAGTNVSHKRLLDIVYDQSEDLDNSWDYDARAAATICSFAGIGIAAVLNPGAVFLAAPVGGAIAGTFGWFCGAAVPIVARWIEELEPKAYYLPWTMRVLTASIIGLTIGQFLGIALGSAQLIFTGPLALIPSIYTAGAVGALICAALGAFYDAKASEMIRTALRFGWNNQAVPPAQDDFRPGSSPGPGAGPGPSTRPEAQSLLMPLINRSNNSSSAEVLRSVPHRTKTPDQPPLLTHQNLWASPHRQQGKISIDQQLIKAKTPKARANLKTLQISNSFIGLTSVGITSIAKGRSSRDTSNLPSHENSRSGLRRDSKSTSSPSLSSLSPKDTSSIQPFSLFSDEASQDSASRSNGIATQVNNIK